MPDHPTSILNANAVTGLTFARRPLGDPDRIFQALRLAEAVFGRLADDAEALAFMSVSSHSVKVHPKVIQKGLRINSADGLGVGKDLKDTAQLIRGLGLGNGG